MFAPTSAQVAVYELAKRFGVERLAPRAIEADEREELPLDLLAAAGELGFGGILVGQERGGAALDRLTCALIFEGLSHGDAAVASFLSVHNMCAWAIDTYGSDDLRSRWLPRLTSLEVFASFCLTEPAAGSDAAALATKAERVADGYLLSGSKAFITGGSVSGLFLVMCRTGGPGPSGVSAMLVERGAVGLSFGPNERKMGWRAQPTNQMYLENVRVPLTSLVGDEGGGLRVALSALDGGRLNIAACSVGAAQAALDRARAYLRDRRAFGHRLSELQALQFRVADAQTELEAARALLYTAATKLDHGSPDASRFCAMAKRYATDVGFRVANEALQLHGGYGYLREYGLEKVVRDLRAHQIVEGTNEVMRHVIARSLAESS